jgi:cephalosporin hydroxylase
VPTTPDATDTGFENEVVRSFHDLYCQNGKRTWRSTLWLGIRVLKCPLDLWVYQEILFAPESRPDLIIETGTARGGSAYFLACMCDLIGSGRVITIDINVSKVPEHPRITYLTGSSTAPEILARVHESMEPGERVMVLLDSDHTKEHVLAELHAYSPLVTQGNYLVVEDTNWNSWRGRFDPGPLEALREFLAHDNRFTVDRTKEKFFMTFHPTGYLLKTGADSEGGAA